MTGIIERDWIKEIGEPVYGTILEMVEALECDYDRLEELREERNSWVENYGGDESEQGRTIAEWGKEFPDEAQELIELETAANCNGEPCADQDEARQRIEDDALSVRVFGERIDGRWEADKFEILLTTGGPAVRIVGELNDSAEPIHAWLEVQDWGKPWTEYYAPGICDTLLTYAGCFYFGE